MAEKKAKKQAVQRLLEEGFFKSAEEAAPWFMSGQVYFDSLRVTSPRQLVPETAAITVKGYNQKYISKGGYKLEGAIADFGIDVTNRVCIDAGACTGGFTDCLIKHGAARVYAVEVGFGQLHGSLRQDGRVINLEKTNISDEKLLTLDPKPDLGSVDLSYLSLRKGVPAFREVMHGKGELMCLVKPLFECENMEARRTGTLTPDAYEPTLLALIDDLRHQPDTGVAGVTYSPVTGNNGTHEFFLHVCFGEDRNPDLTRDVHCAVEKVLQLIPYKK